MRRPTLLLALALPALPIEAAEVPDDLRDAPADAPEPRLGWTAVSSSLLLYDSSGTLAQEVGLGQWPEESGGVMRRRTVRGGASGDGRFAWSFEKIEIVAAPSKPGATPAAAERRRALTYLGTDGQELWRNELADVPKGLDPAAASDDGERVLVAERVPDGWTVALYDFVGNRIVEAHGTGALEVASLSPGGRYALARWHPANRAPVYAWIDAAQKARKRLPLAEPGTAPLRVDDLGRVWAGTKLLFDPK